VCSFCCSLFLAFFDDDDDDDDDWQELYRDHDALGRLPPNWYAIDSDVGTYYANSETNATTWERCVGLGLGLGLGRRAGGVAGRRSERCVAFLLVLSTCSFASLPMVALVVVGRECGWCAAGGTGW
jgi:hypothetical protein